MASLAVEKHRLLVPAHACMSPAIARTQKAEEHMRAAREKAEGSTGFLLLYHKVEKKTSTGVVRHVRASVRWSTLVLSGQP
jgi:hypothetical protein